MIGYYVQQNLEFKQYEQTVASQSELMSETTITAEASIQGLDHGHEPDINVYQQCQKSSLS